MNILVVGDVVGKPGRTVITEFCKKKREELNIDAIIVNGENMSGGSGITKAAFEELLDSGVDVVTTGDHIWKKTETQRFINDFPQLVRPANYPIGSPGNGSYVFEVKGINKPVGVINLLGRVFMSPMDCPFLAVKRELEKLKRETNIIVVDFHAEATSEKVAMGWYLDGEVSLVFGTHTHVPTADETVLPKGTAYITDLGMTGPHDSVIGRDKAIIIERFITSLPKKYEVAKDDVRLNGALVSINEQTGKALKIERICWKI